ncbi:MAG: flagellar export protein FliJ [Firmicutes bacterium ZCTH02-B6]|nr:MAG: flagellar export protein FliJ [Firmicutes bacterium ZCTH02-B6]
MRPFHFSLQRVLDVKRIVEEQRRLAVSHAQAEVAVCAKHLQQTQAARQSAVADAAAHGETVDPAIRAMAWNQRTVLYDRTLSLQAELAERQRSLDQARGVLMNAMKERRALELVAEKRRAAHELAMARLEQKILDDLAGTRAARVQPQPGGPKRG